MTDTEMGRLQEERLGESGRGERERGMWGVETAGGDEGKKIEVAPNRRAVRECEGLGGRVQVLKLGPNHDLPL